MKEFFTVIILILKLGQSQFKFKAEVKGLWRADGGPPTRGHSSLTMFHMRNAIKSKLKAYDSGTNNSSLQK